MENNTAERIQKLVEVAAGRPQKMEIIEMRYDDWTNKTHVLVREMGFDRWYFISGEVTKKEAWAILKALA